MGNLSAFQDKEEIKIQKDCVIEQLGVTDNVRLIAGENELRKKNRYVIDGLLNFTDCNLLMQLAQVSNLALSLIT
jgi:hypothetical protein